MMIENGGRWSFEGGCQLPVIGRRRRQLPEENTSHCQEESLGKTNCQFKKEFLADESDIYVLFVTATEAVFLDKKYQQCGEILDSLLWMNWNSW